MHANNARETINRLTSPPMELPKQILTGLSLIAVQNINRRTGKRRTLQMAEILPDGDSKVIMQLNPIKDQLEFVAEPLTMIENVNLYTGLSKEGFFADIQSKIAILKWMADKNVNDINKIGLIMSKYYRNRPFINVKGV